MVRRSVSQEFDVNQVQVQLVVVECRESEVASGFPAGGSRFQFVLVEVETDP